MTLINKFWVPANEVADVGLKEILMPRLGRFVALAGKNGSGKSRVLTKLEWYVSARLNGYDAVSVRKSRILELQTAIRSNPTHAGIPTWEIQIESERKQLEITLERVADESIGKFKAISLCPNS